MKGRYERALARPCVKHRKAIGEPCFTHPAPMVCEDRLGIKKGRKP